jgi:hypothetical protein
MMGNDHSPFRVGAGDHIELEELDVFGRKTSLVEIRISWSLITAGTTQDVKVRRASTSAA